MKIRVILLSIVIPFCIGFLIAYFQSKPAKSNISFATNNIQPSDTITLSINNDIYIIGQNKQTQITQNQYVIEPVQTNDKIIAVEKNTNYSVIKTFDQSGNLQKTLFNGNSGSIDTMSWATDPFINTEQDKMAYVSDKDKAQTQIPDNALYVMNLKDGKSTNIAQPNAYSGGIAHPIFNPANSNILLFDYYQYDPQSLEPYSIIEQYNKVNGLTTILTIEKLNAYQEAFSPDGKSLMFVGRNGDQNSVTLYIADYTPQGLSNIRSLATGDFAYPTFSNSKNYIYFLKAEGNRGYNLVSAKIQKNALTDILTIVNGFQLLGNSSYSVNNNGN